MTVVTTYLATSTSPFIFRSNVKVRIRVCIVGAGKLLYRVP